MVAHSAIEQVRGTPPRSPSPPGGGTDRERRAAASGENDTTALRKDVGLETPPELTVAHRKRMAELSDMVVDELAFAFGVELREALKGCEQPARQPIRVDLAARGMLLVGGRLGRTLALAKVGLPTLCRRSGMCKCIAGSNPSNPPDGTRRTVRTP